MPASIQNGLVASFVAPRFTSGQGDSGQSPQSRLAAGQGSVQTDTVNLSRNLAVRSATQQAENNQTRLVSETFESLDQGFRRNQIFKRPDGRTFSRAEDVQATARGVRRTVLQQNPSGSTVRLEDSLDREDNGTFRRTLRFTDESGVTKTEIIPGVTGAEPFVLSGSRLPPPSFPPTQTGTRGTQLDIRV